MSARNVGDGVYQDSYTYTVMDYDYSSNQMVPTGETTSYDVMIDTNTGATLVGNSTDGYMVSVKTDSGQVLTYRVNDSVGKNISDYQYLLTDGFQNSNVSHGLLGSWREDTYGRNGELEPYYAGSTHNQGTQTVVIDGKEYEVCSSDTSDGTSPITQYFDSNNGNIDVDSGGDDTSSAGADLGTSGTETSNSGGEDFSEFGINVILGGSYAHVAELLYVEPLKDSDASVFDDFQGEIKSECSNAIELATSINGALAATGSSAFYSGDTASKQVTNLEKASSNAQAAIDASVEVKSSDVSTIITSYNSSLKTAKELVRKELLVKAADEFNRENGFNPVETKTEKKSCSGYLGGGYTTEKISDNGCYKYVTTEMESILDTETQTWSQEVVTKKFKYIKSEGTISQLEERFNFHSATLPYDKSRIVE